MSKKHSSSGQWQFHEAERKEQDLQRTEFPKRLVLFSTNDLTGSLLQVPNKAQERRLEIRHQYKVAMTSIFPAKWEGEINITYCRWNMCVVCITSSTERNPRSAYNGRHRLALPMFCSIRMTPAMWQLRMSLMWQLVSILAHDLCLAGGFTNHHLKHTVEESMRAGASIRWVYTATNTTAWNTAEWYLVQYSQDLETTG